MKKTLIIFITFTLSHLGHSHYLALIPERDIVTATDSKTLHLDILFTHLMDQGPVMDLESPKEFGVLLNGNKIDLKDTLKSKTLQGKQAFELDYKIKRPADYIFYMEPQPYWEPEDNKFIIQYSKVIVDAYAACDGWDSMVGFPAEIEPLVRPYGLWTNNVFRGIIRKNGNPVPFAEIEVEYHNEDMQVPVPADAFITQVIKADANGQFSYALPKAGWWGFAALLEADYKLPGPNGEDAEVELGAVMLVHAVDMP